MKLYRFLMITGLYIFSFLRLDAQIITAEKTGNTYRFSLNPKPAPPIRPQGSTTAPRWLYFWEFGDGHYSEDETPVHTFSQAGSFDVTVWLTPAYSLDKPKKFYQKIQITQSGKTPPEKIYPILNTSSAIRLTSNNNELVPREDMQLVVHYLPPPGYSSGKIVLAFNEKLSVRKSFRYTGARTYYGEKEIADIFSDAGIKGNAEYLQFVESQTNDYQSVVAFSYNQTTPGEASRLFLTLHTETPPIGTEIGVRAFLIPDKGALRKTGTTTSKTMIIQASHDPNRITVIPRTIEYPVSIDTFLTYRVFFQNKGEGDANEVTVKVNLDPSLDPETIEVIDARIGSDSCLICNDSLAERESCLEVIRNPDHVSFIFHYIRLSGTKGIETINNLTTRGEVAYRIRPRTIPGETAPSVKDIDAIFTRASIKFDTENDTIITNQIDTQIRLRVTGIKAGYNLGRPLSELVSSATALSNVLLGVTFSDNPVHKGKAFQSEIAYSSYRFSRDKSQLLVSENDPFRRDSVHTRLSLNLFYLDVLAQSRFHFNDYIGVGFGGGFSTLLAGAGKYEARLKKGISQQTVEEKVRTGLLFLGKQYESIEFASGDVFDPEIRNNPGSYLALNMFAELGLGKVNKGPMAGFRYGSRFQSGLFDFSFSRQNFLQAFAEWKF
ncbi:MAG: PKD domain-containing protein [Bacteroidia bacterium]